MIQYFIHLFNYNYFANQTINNLLLTRPTAQTVKLMAHLLSAEKLWLMRCKGIGAGNLKVWPDSEAETLANNVDVNYHDWIAFLNDIQEGDLEKTIRYQNSHGVDFDTLLSDMITQVLNHGTHTRAQIGQLLKLSDGDKLPVTDYIYYSRQLDK